MNIETIEHVLRNDPGSTQDEKQFGVKNADRVNRLTRDVAQERGQLAQRVETNIPDSQYRFDRKRDHPAAGSDRNQAFRWNCLTADEKSDVDDRHR
jgi:hypothetical protein